MTSGRQKPVPIINFLGLVLISLVASTKVATKLISGVRVCVNKNCRQKNKNVRSFVLHSLEFICSNIFIYNLT